MARDIIAREDLVPFARSATDGFAVRSTDLIGVPASLPLVGAAYAAAGGDEQLKPGTATAVATGAALPAGADCVIPVEHGVVDSGHVTITRGAVRGSYIVPAGDDARRGDVLLAAGTLVTPARIGLLAAAGTRAVEVYRRPTVAIVCGGDELVGVEETPEYGQVRDSNSAMLAAAIAAAGGQVLAPLRVRDHPPTIRDALRQALAEADLVVTSGGASAGERDYVKAACIDVGVDLCFDSVALRPAKSTAFGRHGEARLAVLPGNPAAAFVALQEFVLPAIRALRGQSDPLLPRVQATLRGAIRAKASRHFAAFAAVWIGADGLTAIPLQNQCPASTRMPVDAAGFIIVAPGTQTHANHERVDVDIFDWTYVVVAPSTAGLPAPSRLRLA